MNKILVVGILLCLFVVGNAAATVEITLDSKMECVGIINRDIEMQTDALMDGQKYTSILRTPSLGLYGRSELKYNEELNAIIGDDTDIEVLGAFAGNYTIGDYCLRNYKIGVRQAFNYKGNSMVDYEFIGDNTTSNMAIEGITVGEMEYNILVRNTTSYTKIFTDDFEMNGISGFKIDSHIEDVLYPCVGYSDWLGCP